MKKSPGNHIKAKIWVIENGKIQSRSDRITTEEPLEIRLTNPAKTIAITMRTPGADFDLVAGFLYTEGIISQRDDIERMSYCVEPEIEEEQRYNIVSVKLRSGLLPNLPSLERHFFTTSACGICGKASIEALRMRGIPAISHNQSLAPQFIYNFSEQLRAAQGIFQATGGLHAAAIFDCQGKLIKLREDVGRHNALDKLIGSAFLAGELPLNCSIVMVSGRTSFEILQKSIVAGVPIVCGVSAPSSLAVSLAKEFGITLIGFLRGQRFNVYSGIERFVF